MNRFKTLLKLILIMGMAMAISACSKTVQWEEEVLLNTGETIIVKREVVYTLKGDAGNPFDMAYRPDSTETLSFNWQDKNYRYTGDAGLMVIAISPTGLKPVLAARVDINGWGRKNNYPCAKPSYVQLNPSDDRRTWLWPPSIDPWLYDFPANLMQHRGELGELKKKYSIQDKTDADAVIRASRSLGRIDPTFVFLLDCKGKI